MIIDIVKKHESQSQLKRVQELELQRLGIREKELEIKVSELKSRLADLNMTVGDDLTARQVVIWMSEQGYELKDLQKRR